MGDGEEMVIADIVTAGLTGVAVEVFLLVAPDLLGGHHKDHEPENEDHRQPDSTKRRGVLVHPAQEALEEGPIHDVVLEK